MMGIPRYHFFQKVKQLIWALSSCLLLASCGPDLPDDVATAYEGLPQKLDFNIHVKPILSDKCFACHGPDRAKVKGNLQLHSVEAAFASRPNSQRPALSPGKLSKSEVFHRITSEDPDYQMPTPESNLSLTALEKATLIKWIEQGAGYEPHWAFQGLRTYDPPTVSWPTVNPIDQFIFYRLEKEGLQPSQEADKQLLLRRLSLDLTGLPPTPEETDQFVNDTSAEAYEKQVDRLLSSPHYGEKMTTDWLDLARFADTHGYTVDRYRDMSPWRDWVIRSFNDNMSYEDFVTWQLAGDLLPEASRDQILATGFNRLHPQNQEGGIIDEEFRVEYVADRAVLFGQGFMGMTLSCARCHDHKFDPISQKEFYELYSFFNNVNESGQISWDDATPVPTLMLPTEEQQAVMTYLQAAMETEEEKLISIQAQERMAAEEWVNGGGYRHLESTPTRGLQAHFPLDGHLRNSLQPTFSGHMQRQFSKDEIPQFEPGYDNQGLKLDGDAWLDLDHVGLFKRNNPFSIGLWVNIPKDLDEGVIFHKNDGSRLYSFKGYYLYLIDDRLELALAHTWPDNAIIRRTTMPVPREEWIHLTVTYDGSSKATGLKLYLNGEPATTEVINDNLYKDIVFGYTEDQEPREGEPGLQLGARWRGKGVGGTLIDELRVYSESLSAVEVRQMANPRYIVALSQKTPDDLSDQERKDLVDYFLSYKSAPFRAQLASLHRARRPLVDSMEQVKEIMVMKEMPKPRRSYVLERGGYDNYGEEVFPNTPERILPWKDELPRNRLGLARWLFDPDHPLTARVAVNRYWQNYFGRGLVRTTEDFGNQGDLPSHPKLLDWLASEFVRSGWDVKHMQKLIVMSATYRQSSQGSDVQRPKDPNNILLSRGPRTRLSSEMMRDNALVASGLLNPDIGGRSVRPYQPEGLWNMNGGNYVQDTGEDLYRRSMYVFWKRTVPHPTLQTFDQPERTECTVRRQRTNTPLQALVLLNDPAYVEAARKMGERITQAQDLRSGIEEAFRRATGRRPVTDEIALLEALQAEEYRNFLQAPQKAAGWLNVGESQTDQTLDQATVAANAVVASVILNADASITKR